MAGAAESSQPAVDTRVAEMLMRRLSGFRGYPNTPAGEAYFVQCFQEAVISVDHAREAIAQFDEQFPTLKELRDCCRNLRPKFERTPDPRQEWERTYGPPDQAFATGVQSNLLDAVESDLHARDRVMWRKIAEHLGTKDWAKVSWPKVYRAMDELGYPLAPSQREMLNRGGGSKD